MQNLLTLPVSAAPVLASPVAPSPTSSHNGSENGLMLLGPSTAMATLWSQVRRLAPHVRTVLLTGSPDSGQEAVARLLLDLSFTPQRPFIVLTESDAEGRLAQACQAHAGPHDLFLFLPAVERLSPSGQQHLLRLLKTRRTRALSVVASTVEDLRSLASMGRFSGELAELLGTVRIGVPALKDRVEDVPMLLSQMLAQRSRALQGTAPPLSEELLRAAMQHAWPGNFHELSAVAQVLLDEYVSGSELRAADLVRALGNVQTPTPPTTSAVRMIKLDTVVQEHVYAVLRGCRGNKLKAAEVLGISRSTLYRMLDAATQNNSMSLAS